MSFLRLQLQVHEYNMDTYWMALEMLPGVFLPQIRKQLSLPPSYSAPLKSSALRTHASNQNETMYLLGIYKLVLGGHL